MSGPDETRTQPPPPDGATHDFDPGGATAEFANAAPVPGYVAAGELGRGAMGVVLKARDSKLNREVAIKMPLGGPRERIRFLAEAEAVAAIRHPNVVQVYEYGEHAGRPFLVLEFVPGGTLADRLASPLHDPAALLGKIARGVAAGHALGVVHRDLKPANVLLTADGEPKVTDFGLAKRGGGAELTQTGAVMGTPAYMAPEQAEGGSKFVGPAADVWALGVILYECLTGTRPFDGRTTGELLAAVARANPEKPRKRSPSVPRDLELICLKCLEKNPADRYPTAAELADDLERFAAGRPVSVRAAGLLERGYKWAKRKPALAGLYAACLLAVVLGGFAAVALRLWHEADEQRQWSDKARGQLAVEKREAETARKDAEGAQKEAEKSRDEAQKARAALALAEYARTIDLAHRVYREGDLTRSRSLLRSLAPELRGWEWDYLDRLVHPELVSTQTAQRFRAAEFTPDGKRLVTVGDDDATVWDAATGDRIRTLRGVVSRDHGSATSADGRRFAAARVEETATGVRFGVRVWSLETGAEVANFDTPEVPAENLLAAKKPPPAGFPVRSPERFLAQVDLDPTGKEVGLVCGGQRLAEKQVHVWDVGTGKRLTAGAPFPGGVDALAHTTAGWRITATDATAPVRVFDLGGNPVTPAGADGLRVAVFRTGTWQVYNTGTGLFLPRPPGTTSKVELSQDGLRVAWVNVAFGVGDTHTVHVTGPDGGQPRPLPGRFAAAPVFSPCGRRLATVSANTTVRVWDADTAAELFAFVTYSPGPPTGERTLAALLRPAGAAPHLAFSPDLSRLAGVSPDGLLRVWDVRFRPPPTPIFAADATPTRVVNTPSGWRVILGRRPITVWNPDTDAAVTIDPRLRTGSELAVGAGRALVAANGSDELRLWSLETGQLLRTFAVGTRPVGLAFSPDGKSIGAIDAVENVLRVWDVDSGTETFAVPVPQNRGVAVRFSTDGRRVKVVPVPVRQGGADTPPTIQKREWELATRQPRDPTDDDAPADTERVVVGPAAGKVELPFDATSPDGKRRVVVGTDNGVRLGGAGISQELLTLAERRGDVTAVAFSADGRRVLVAGPGGAEIFDATPRTSVVRWLDTAPPPRAKP